MSFIDDDVPRENKTLNLGPKYDFCESNQQFKKKLKYIETDYTQRQLLCLC